MLRKTNHASDGVASSRQVYFAGRAITGLIR
jgi:hypothetical protein